MIESVNNELIKKYAKLQQKKYRDREGLFIVEGEHLVEEAKKADIVVTIFSLEEKTGCIRVSEKVMQKLSMLPSVPTVLAICRKREEKPIVGDVLALDGIQDPGNLGTIIRSSVAFGIDTIILSEDTCDEYNWKVLRAAEGMNFHINIIRQDLKRFIQSNSQEYHIYSTDVVKGTSLNEVLVVHPFILVMGNEGNGVKPEIADCAKDLINISMKDNCESLNVAVATSIILYDFFASKK